MHHDMIDSKNNKHIKLSSSYRGQARRAVSSPWTEAMWAGMHAAYLAFDLTIHLLVTMRQRRTPRPGTQQQPGLKQSRNTIEYSFSSRWNISNARPSSATRL
jgi:hypothetical protein